MKKLTAFWDASALVPLCVHEAASRQARSHLMGFAPVVWWGVSSKFAVRFAASIATSRYQTSTNKEPWLVWHYWIAVGGKFFPMTKSATWQSSPWTKYSLRADSLQLAASLIWCEQRPSKRNFICGDHRLALAADSAGFSVLEL